MPKHLELEFGSIGEMISMLRYNDHLTVADLQRPLKVTLDIDTSAPLDGTYLHIAGPISSQWLKTDPGEGGIRTGTTVGAIKKAAKRIIGFRQPSTEAETETPKQS